MQSSLPPSQTAAFFRDVADAIERGDAVVEPMARTATPDRFGAVVAIVYLAFLTLVSVAGGSPLGGWWLALAVVTRAVMVVVIAASVWRDRVTSRRPW